MHLNDILRAKGEQVHTIDVTARLADVVTKMIDCNCGSLVVTAGGEMVGIITERDILRACASLDEPLTEIPVAAKMTSDMLTGSPQDDVNDVMGLLTENRIRHLPILREGKLAGIISIGDVVKAQHQQLIAENYFLKNYIQS